MYHYLILITYILSKADFRILKFNQQRIEAAKSDDKTIISILVVITV